MLENIKTGVLILLILLSLGLTYQMWFGAPPGRRYKAEV